MPGKVKLNQDMVVFGSIEVTGGGILIDGNQVTTLSGANFVESNGDIMTGDLIFTDGPELKTNTLSYNGLLLFDSQTDELSEININRVRVGGEGGNPPVAYGELTSKHLEFVANISIYDFDLKVNSIDYITLQRDGNLDRNLILYHNVTIPDALIVDGTINIQPISVAPTGTTDTAGEENDFTWDENYIYVKTATGWKRSALSTF